MPFPEFSVVIPLYNKEVSISQTIASVLGQRYEYFELIIVDDGSTDGSYNVVSKFTDSRVRLFRKDNGGVSSARNFGVSKAVNEFVIFLDADDEWDDGLLNVMNGLIGDFPDALTFGLGYSRKLDERTLVRAEIDLPNRFRGYIDNYFSYNRKMSIFHPSATAIRRASIVDIGGFDETLTKGEDWDVWIRMAMYGRMAYDNRSYMIYHEDAENRCMNTVQDKSKSLIWRLSKYSDNLQDDQVVALFDSWRIAHVKISLCGINTEVRGAVDVNEIFGSISPCNLSSVFRLIRRLDSKTRVALFRALLLLSPFLNMLRRAKAFIALREVL